MQVPNYTQTPNQQPRDQQPRDRQPRDQQMFNQNSVPDRSAQQLVKDLQELDPPGQNQVCGAIKNHQKANKIRCQKIQHFVSATNNNK